MAEQLSLFSSMEGNYKIEKPIRLIEFFAGIGAQEKALEILGIPFESWKICEWAYNSIIAYNAIHTKDYKDYSEGKTKEELIAYLNGNISTNYNETCDCTKKPLEWLKNAYNNCIATHNLMNIMKVKGEDLEITETDKYDYILTYSFPCQDLSLAGKRAGMSVSQANGGTRSGLLWEVERILTELSLSLSLPQILIMENVPEVVGSTNIKDFQKWESKLNSLGYVNHIQILNAKDYGIPQNRKRCFMVSVLNGNFEFGGKMPLKYKLKDVLEDDVDDKYFLSQKMLEGMLKTDFNSYKLENRIQDIDGCVDTLTTSTGNRCPHLVSGLPILGKTKKGYKIAEIGDGVDISGRMKYHRGNVQKGTCQTLLTSGDNVGVVVKDESLFSENEKKLFTEDGNIRRYIGSDKIDEFKEGQMATTTFPNGYGHGTRVHDMSITLNTIDKPCVKHNLRIRKLTPKECCRLMGFEDKDYEAMKKAGLSDSAIYHCCGDSIVSTVLMMVFSRLCENENEYRKRIEKYVETKIIDKR